MKFSEYYKRKDVVESYEERRGKGLKADIVRYLERFAVKELLGNYKGKVLEAGVGTGFITEILIKRGEVEGFDISDEMLKKTRSKFPKIKLQKQDLLNLRIKKKYPGIVSVRVVSHFKPDEAVRALRNLQKITTEDGFVIFNLENPSPTRRLLRKILNWGSTETYQYSKQEVERVLNESNLEMIDFVYIDHFFLVPLHFLNKLLGNKLSNKIKNIETGMKKVRFSSNNIFIKCQK